MVPGAVEFSLPLKEEGVLELLAIG